VGHRPHCSLVEVGHSAGEGNEGAEDIGRLFGVVHEEIKFFGMVTMTGSSATRVVIDKSVEVPRA